MHCPYCKSQSVVNNKSLSTRNRNFVCLSCHKDFKHTSILQRSLPWIMSIGAIIALSPVLLYGSMKLVVSLLPRGKDSAPEAIVVLGRGPEQQAESALAVSQLWRNRQLDQQLPTVFVSGMIDAPPVINLLEEMGIPQDQVTGERCSQSTWENGLFSEAILSSQGTKRILLVTDEAHMPRAFLVFNSLGFEVVPHTISSDTMGLFSLERTERILREYAAIAVYGITGKLHAGSSEQQRKNRARANYQISDWGCQLE